VLCGSENQNGNVANPAKLVAAAACNLGIIPFTILCLTPINQKLHLRQAIVRRKRSAAGREGSMDAGLQASEQADTMKLIENWAFLNLLRSLLPLAAALLAWCSHI
jgi:hypothetical protein